MKKTKIRRQNIKYKEFKIAQDGVTVAVNKDNDFVKELSKDQLKNLQWRSKTWKDVDSSWPNKEIKAFLQTQVMVLMTSGKKKLWINKISKLKNGDTNVIVQSVEKNKVLVTSVITSINKIKIN